MTIENNVLDGALVPHDDDDTIGREDRPFKQAYFGIVHADEIDVPSGVGVSGSGTANTPAMWTGVNTIGNITSGKVTNAMLANSSVSITAGTGLSGGGTATLGGAAVTLTNAGVTSAIAGSGISVSGATGDVTISANAAALTDVLQVQVFS